MKENLVRFRFLERSILLQVARILTHFKCGVVQWFYDFHSPWTMRMNIFSHNSWRLKAGEGKWFYLLKRSLLLCHNKEIHRKYQGNCWVFFSFFFKEISITDYRDRTRTQFLTPSIFFREIFNLWRKSFLFAAKQFKTIQESSTALNILPPSRVNKSD